MRWWKGIPALLLSAVVAGSCGTGSGPTLDQTPETSGCGGFPVFEKRDASDDPEYCAAERLHWAYDEQALRLSLTDTRIGLNCCGNHSIEVEPDGPGYLIRERDDPMNEGRCLCSCVFDFSVIVDGVLPGAYPFRLLRIEARGTEDGYEDATDLDWSGTIDLAAGSGSVVLDDTPFHEGCRQGLSK